MELNLIDGKISFSKDGYEIFIEKVSNEQRYGCTVTIADGDQDSWSYILFISIENANKLSNDEIIDYLIKRANVECFHK